MFGCVDRYYSPFIAPDSSGRFKVGNLKDIYPENNKDIVLIPQVLANNPKAFLAVTEELSAMGYSEVNLNAGCPSGTVVAKHKGAGMLQDLGSFRAFLDEIFSDCKIDISIKTRMGFNSTDEFQKLIELYNNYPIKLLTVHARDKVGQYKSIPDIDCFERNLSSIISPVEYNGNIFTNSNYVKFTERFPDLNHIMIGRGSTANPAVFREIKRGKTLEKEELKVFHDTLMHRFKEIGLNDRFNMARLKELWHYMALLFPDGKKEIKAINKSRSMDEYVSAVDILFDRCFMDSSQAYLLQP